MFHDLSHTSAQPWPLEKTDHKTPSTTLDTSGLTSTAKQHAIAHIAPTFIKTNAHPFLLKSMSRHRIAETRTFPNSGSPRPGVIRQSNIKTILSVSIHIAYRYLFIGSSDVGADYTKTKCFGLCEPTIQCKPCSPSSLPAGASRRCRDDPPNKHNNKQQAQ